MRECVREPEERGLSRIQVRWGLATDRVGTLIFGKTPLRYRNRVFEEAVRRVSSHPSWPERPISLCGSLVTCDGTPCLVHAVFWQRDGESVGCDPRLNRLGGMIMMMDVPKRGVRSIDQWHSTLLPIEVRAPFPVPPPSYLHPAANRDPPPSFWFKTRQTKQKSHSAENERARPKHAQGGKRIKNSPRASQGGGGDRERESNARLQMSRGG